MALITCPECGKEISDKAQACPNCGAPINTPIEEKICCPQCGRTDITFNQKGYSGGKALVGAVAVGGLGLLAGTHGSNQIIATCLKCGKQFDPTSAKRIRKNNNVIKFNLTSEQKDYLIGCILFDLEYWQKQSIKFPPYHWVKRELQRLTACQESDTQVFVDNLLNELATYTEEQKQHCRDIRNEITKEQIEQEKQNNKNGCAAVLILALIISSLIFF